MFGFNCLVSRSRENFQIWINFNTESSLLCLSGAAHNIRFLELSNQQCKAGMIPSIPMQVWFHQTIACMVVSSIQCRLRWFHQFIVSLDGLANFVGLDRLGGRQNKKNICRTYLHTWFLCRNFPQYSSMKKSHFECIVILNLIYNPHDKTRALCLRFQISCFVKLSDPFQHNYINPETRFGDWLEN